MRPPHPPSYFKSDVLGKPSRKKKRGEGSLVTSNSYLGEVIRQVSPRTSVPPDICPPDICPPMDNCQGGQMSGGTLVLGGHLSGGTLVQGDKCPGGTVVLGGHLSRGTNVGGTTVQGDTCPGGQMSGGHLSGGQMSHHRVCSM